MSEHQFEAPPLYGSTRSTTDQREALRNGDVPVAVYGLGKMGLPLAAVYADVTGNVTGADIDESVVERINAGECPVENEPGLDELVESSVTDGSLRAVDDPAVAARDARVHVIVVPTLLGPNNTPDLSTLDAAVTAVGEGLDAGDLVVVESTVPPRTCRDRVCPSLTKTSGLDAEEFGIAFCPERTSSGRALRDIRGAYPKIVGGLDDEATRVADLVYGEITSNDVIPVSDATTAECVKVFEGAYRDVNIALANELSTYADEFDASVVEAIEAANTQPFCDLHTPGAGVGGHCIPYYSYFLVNGFETASPLLGTARQVNERMPTYTADYAIDALSAGGINAADADVLVLGLGYRPGVDETRHTPARRIIERLVDAGADVTATDPVVTDASLFESLGATVRDLDDAVDQRYDAVVLVTDQNDFADLDIPALSRPGRPLAVVDGRQALTHLQDHPDVAYRGIGVNT